MGRYILRRILINIPILIVITILVFALVEIAPGDMVDFFINDETMSYLSEEDLDEMREKFGLNDPAPVRYFKWMGQILQGDFGFSYVESYPVNELLLARLKNSAILMGTGLIFAIGIGIPLGIFTALRQYSFIDFLLTGLSFIGLSMPAFISGIIGMYIFAVKLQWVPAGGMHTPTVNTFTDLLHHLALPASILAMMHGAQFMRYQRFSMLEVLNQDYVTTATAKGMRRRIVINRHALRNALIPVITVIGLTFSQFVAGAVFLETIFAWPGMGRLYYNAVISRDYPIIMGANLVIAVVVLLANLVTDITYAVVDPRVRYE
jgi:peptide/nickel transport system permease protein